MTAPSFHARADRREPETHSWQEWQLSVRFAPHFHPYVRQLLERLIQDSVPGVQDADTGVPALHAALFTDQQFRPQPLVAEPYPVAELDFDPAGAYAVYNWELFFHAPVAIAVHLADNGRYDDALRWFGFVFDPHDDSAGPTPERFWKVKPFRTTDVQSIEDILVNLSSGADQELLERTWDSIRAWAKAPFRPHVIARHRPSSYMIWTVMQYVRTLIRKGDSLFAQDTSESVAEATQAYVMAANILGPRPQAAPPKGTVLPQTYATLRGRLDAMSNVLVRLENALPFDRFPAPGPTAPGTAPRRLAGLGQSLYFQVPPNRKLLELWDTVADRLFKIRNSLTVQGVFRHLPAFEPRIEPALLARAAAAGVDVAAVVAGLDQPPPLVRFTTLLARADQLCQDVRSLGGALLSAIERQDERALEALRARHETAVLERAETIRYAEHQEAIKNREGIEQSLTLAKSRYRYYQRLLGRPTEEQTVTDPDPLDPAELESGRFTATEPVIALPDVEVDLDPTAVPAGGGPAEGRKVSRYEAAEIAQIDLAEKARDDAADNERQSAEMNRYPTGSVSYTPLGVGFGVSYGGSNLGAIWSAYAAQNRTDAQNEEQGANRKSKIGGYQRREQEWQYQRNLAAGEVNQLNKQLRAAQIREFIAGREHADHHRQLEQSRAIEEFLAGEGPVGATTTAGYYARLRRDVRGLYGQYYQLAIETARKAERALRNELGDPSLTFIRPSYLAGSEGLLAGERLQYDLRRMELAHLDLNRREYELTQQVSLAQIAPLALLQLRRTGGCTFTVPEEALDVISPGLYFRRIRSVAVTIPCVTGDVPGVPCTARLLRSRIRASPLVGDGYPYDPDGDDRFTEIAGAPDAIVTSRGVDDTGTFEPPGADERLAPFALRGVIGEWSLELPADPAPVDWDTLTDVVLTFRYTARDGGEPLRRAAGAHLRGLLAAGGAAGCLRLLSVQHEFPNAWARFTASAAGDGAAGAPRAALALQLDRKHYPVFAGAGPTALVSIDVVAVPANPATTAITMSDRALDTDNPGVPRRSLTLAAAAELGGLLRGELPRPAVRADPGWPTVPPAAGELSLFFEDNAMESLFLLLRWRA
ncbi:hypothetical protein RMN56_20660 [Micromonospora halotolerans]|uniref:Tc toxin complex TcA C-terminal TcB-binding domain-containing protein n=1 Tax=Micromonospora halotolerans TaxID=709879 RepID=A0ABY9ZQL0_9ACTN|nr:hypothetical protein [Micromonospora halotolerans]WNM37569.1 hypothetical protein RMN56_20660 [Micromonospora halotolerans]